MMGSRLSEGTSDNFSDRLKGILKTKENVVFAFYYLYFFITP